MDEGRKAPGNQTRYLAYLLRLWREAGSGAATWRASLEDPHTGEKVGFASLAHLCAYLAKEFDQDSIGTGHSRRG